MKKKLLILLSLVFFTPFIVEAYEVNVEWQKSWGGNKGEYINEIIQTDDGGVVEVGGSKSTDIDGLINKGDQDAIIVKYDKDGNLLWQKSWGGSGYESFMGVIQTKDGGFVTYGEFYSTDIDGLSNKGLTDAVIVKYDKDGNLLWQKSWGGSDTDQFKGIYETEDGGILVYGSLSSKDTGLLVKGSTDSLIIKYDNDGNMLWQKTWGGNGQDFFSNLFEANDGGLIFNCFAMSTDIEGLLNKGSIDNIFVKYDKDWNLLWQKSWVSGNKKDTINNLFQTEDGGFITIGTSQSTDIEGLPNKGSQDIIIVKYDKDWNLLWKKSWGGNGQDLVNYVGLTEDSGFIIYGQSSSTDIEGLPNKADRDIILLKYDKDGNLLSQKSFGGNGYDTLTPPNLIQNNRFIVSYMSESTDIEGLPNKGDFDGIIVKFDKDWDLLWQKSWGGNGQDYFHFIQIQDDGFIAYGNSQSTDIDGLPNKGGQDLVVVKYLIEYNLENVIAENGTSTVEQQGKYGIITPTPDNGYKVDKIVVKDSAGNEIDVTKLEDGTYSFTLTDDVTVDVSFIRDYSISLVYTKNGEVEINKLDDGRGIVRFTPHIGFEFDKVIVKNSKDELIEVTKLEDGSYSFELSDDVSVEVVFKRELVNPKTGVTNSALAIFVGFIISMIGFLIVKRYNERLEI